MLAWTYFVWLGSGRNAAKSVTGSHALQRQGPAHGEGHAAGTPPTLHELHPVELQHVDAIVLEQTGPFRRVTVIGLGQGPRSGGAKGLSEAPYECPASTWHLGNYSAPAPLPPKAPHGSKRNPSSSMPTRCWEQDLEIGEMGNPGLDTAGRSQTPRGLQMGNGPGAPFVGHHGPRRQAKHIGCIVPLLRQGCRHVGLPEACRFGPTTCQNATAHSTLHLSLAVRVWSKSLNHTQPTFRPCKHAPPGWGRFPPRHKQKAPCR